MLLLKNSGIVKTVRFKNPVYIGDPINIVKIFNEKEVDELCFMDIDASIENREPPFKLLEEIASECFMPLSYGGGVKTLDQIKQLITLGIEKVIINSAAFTDPTFLSQAVDRFGSSTIVGCIDSKKDFLGRYRIFSHSKKKILPIDPLVQAQELMKAGVGELIINNVDRDGTLDGYDHSLISRIKNNLNIPVVALGGCNSVEDIHKVINQTNASAAAAGSFFVFKGPHRAVLITYPSSLQMDSIRESSVGM